MFSSYVEINMRHFLTAVLTVRTHKSRFLTAFVSHVLIKGLLVAEDALTILTRKLLLGSVEISLGVYELQRFDAL